MNNTTKSLDSAIQAIANEARFDWDAHPSLDQIADYQARKLTADAHEQMQDHLALCHTCTELLLDLSSFPHLEPPENIEPASDQEVEAAWREMSPELLAAAGVETTAPEKDTTDSLEELPDNVARPFFGTDVARLNQRMRHLSVAATLLLAVGSLWIATLYGRLQKQSAPQYATVLDIDTARSSRTYPVSPNAGRILLIVKNFDLGTYSQGQLEISKGNAVLRTDDFKPSPDDQSLLHLTLSRDRFPAGSYRVKIFGLDANGRQLLKDIGLTLKDSG